MRIIVHRRLIEPPELGDCDDRDCSTVSPAELARQSPAHELRPGLDTLLVAEYGQGRNRWRVCAACDERRLRLAILPAVLEEPNAQERHELERQRE